MERIHRRNPQTGKEWDIVTFEPELELDPDMIILLLDGEKMRLVHKDADLMLAGELPWDDAKYQEAIDKFKFDYSLIRRQKQ